MNIIDIITKKKNKQVLSYEELMYAFNGYLNKEIKDYQMSALLMAITINGMTYEETLDLTDILLRVVRFIRLISQYVISIVLVELVILLHLLLLLL